MPIPRTRRQLTELLTSTYAKLEAELEAAGPDAGSLPCVDDWTVKDLLAVRAWWTEQVVDWIEAGRRGETPVTPAPGYKWNETPRLNSDLARAAGGEAYDSVRDRLERGVERALAIVRRLDDAELLEPGAYEWAGKWPVARWLSINTARQYTTARTWIRRAVRAAS